MMLLDDTEALRKRLAKARRAEEKAQRKARAKGVVPRPRVFVLDFHGDLQAHAVASLRQEISSVLQVARKEDEILVRLTHSACNRADVLQRMGGYPDPVQRGVEIPGHDEPLPQGERPAFDPRFVFSWPTHKIAVMGGEQAAKTLLQIQVSAMKSKGLEVPAEEEARLLNEIKSKYEAHTTPYYAAARLWVDAIIDPMDTRKLISEAIHAANHNPVMESFKTGVFQV